jgi:hypothetical protein
MRQGTKRFIDAFKFFDIFFQKKGSARFQHVYGIGVFLYQLLVQVVFMIPSLLFGFDEAGFHQDFDVVANGGLCEVDNVLYFGTLTATTFFGDVLQDFEAIRVAQSL